MTCTYGALEDVYGAKYGGLDMRGRAQNLVGYEGFERDGRWLVCVLTGCRIDAERFRQDVLAYLRAYYGTTAAAATGEQLEQAERDAERYYRDILEMALENHDGYCACGARLLQTTAPYEAYLCPGCRILVPTSFVENVTT